MYLVIDFTQKVDNFMAAEAGGMAMVLFFIYKIPLIVVQMAPAAALISVIILFSTMKKNSEITGVKASGISVLRFSLPILISALLVSIGVFVFSELIVPFASTKSNDIWQKEVKKQDQQRFYNRSHIWFKGQKGIYWIRHFDGKQMVMEDAVFYLMDDLFQLTRRIDAKRVVWSGTGWKAEQGMVMGAKLDDPQQIKTFAELDLDLHENPEDFLRIEKRPEEMSYWELRHFAEKSALEGYDETRYLVDLNAKLSFSLLSFIIVLIGISITLGLKKGGAPLAVSLGIASSFFYVMLHGIFLSFGYSGVLPPVFSAWLASAVALLMGCFLFIRVET